MTSNVVSLDDKYLAERGQVFMSGLQALVRLPIEQQKRDAAAGLNTAGFISGYRGSPLGRYDMELWRVKALLKKHNITFVPGVNEDLAATSIWGTQEVNLFPGAKYDGVFGIWYGKGPGLARSMDAFKHGNQAGAFQTGGVLAIVGDDHGATSSAFALPSEFSFMDAMMPVIYPAGMAEFIELGLLGFGLSRACGLWVGYKTEADTVEASGTLYLDPDEPKIVRPRDLEIPEGGLSIRVGEMAIPAETRQHKYKLEAAKAFARANGLNKLVLDAPRARFGIVTAGKSYLDVRRALRILGIDDKRGEALGIRLLKLGMIWPLEPTIAAKFARGLEEVFVIEEKRSFIETQMKELLYPDRATAPRIVGKTDETGAELLPAYGVHTPEQLAREIGKRLLAMDGDDSALAERLAFLDGVGGHKGSEGIVARTPYFCSGCPHNTSTRVPEGSRAVGGVGCHFMAVWMDRDVYGWTQMGGEGATWIGQAPHTETNHIFQALGDGTYYHSGLMAMRAAKAAGINITYKILYNDAVAMTGGQPIDGPISVPMISRQVADEGIDRIAVVSDEPDKYPIGSNFAPGVSFHHRRDLDDVQRELRDWPGVSALIYDQTCAAEKRRRRKRGTFPDPDKRIFINQEVCEGCGDCVEQSNCLSVVPLETELGQKRTIDQHSCNKDFSCLNGFCPALVSVEGGRPKRAAMPTLSELKDPPAPKRARSDEPYGVLVTGIGGTGVITIGAILGMAAHIEGKGCTILDMTGMSQKGGAVVSHIRIADATAALDTNRLSAGTADLVIGADALVASTGSALDTMTKGRTSVLINEHKTLTGASVVDRSFNFETARLRSMVEETVGADRVYSFNANKLAAALVGDAIASNTFMLGYAVQKGLVPVGLDAIEEAFRLNAVAVESNLHALRMGRIAAHDPQAVEALLDAMKPKSGDTIAQTLDEVIARRVEQLTAYQDAAYAARYTGLVETVRAAEAAAVKGKTDLTEAAARYYYKLLAYKDEYEVARLYTDGRFHDRLAAAFDGNLKLTWHLAPPTLGGGSADGKRPPKRPFRTLARIAFPLLARMKRLRGTPLDIFGYHPERKVERALIEEYEATIATVLEHLGTRNHGMAVELASIPDLIRGFGPVKNTNITKAKAHQAELLKAYTAPEGETVQAAE
ncbi:MAG TPA: indolepyruvate ferredoxin oxidoreductase family protein [Alphaproteobacteria bacterium]|nr:indolepyruvate ferredoxin oxidoreductase family protein [Alphaproteobacteria bacterium]